MKLRSLLACSALLVGSAQAATFDFGVSLSPDLASPFTFRGGLSDVRLGGNRFSVAASNRAAELGVRRNLPLTALGTLQLGLGGALVYAGDTGVRLSADVSGSLASLALSASGRGWTAPTRALDPLSVWNEDATDPAKTGLQADLSARYRASRNLIVNLGGELGAQSSASVVGEWRGPAVSYRLGAQGGSEVLGVLAGLTYRAEDVTLTADALLGRSYGGSLKVDAPVLMPISAGQAIGLSAYLNYEPWRTAALPLRYGVDVGVPLGLAVDGQLSFGVRGGTGGVGFRAGYTFTPGGVPPEQP